MEMLPHANGRQQPPEPGDGGGEEGPSQEPLGARPCLLHTWILASGFQS